MENDKATIEGQDQTITKDVDNTITREQFEQLTKQLESTKKELSSRDSKIGEYQKEMSGYKQTVEDLKTANLTAEEKLNLRVKELEINIQSEKGERTRATNKAEAIKRMNDLNIDVDLIDLIPLDDIEKMNATIEKLHSSTEKLMQEGAKSVVNKIGGNVPTGGVPSGAVTMEQYKSMSPKDQDKFLASGQLPK